jgi:hypothetical protein
MPRALGIGPCEICGRDLGRKLAAETHAVACTGSSSISRDGVKRKRDRDGKRQAAHETRGVDRHKGHKDRAG